MTENESLTGKQWRRGLPTDGMGQSPATGGGHTMGLRLFLLVEESLLQPLLRLDLLLHNLVHLVWPINHTLSEG